MKKLRTVWPCLVDLKAIKDVDCLVFAVAHDVFKQMSLAEIDSLFREVDYQERIIIDVKSILDKTTFEKKGYCFWRL